MRSFISKNRGQLLQAISAFVEELEKARKDYVPILCKRAFPTIGNLMPTILSKSP